MSYEMGLVVAIDFGTTSSGVCWQTKTRAQRNMEPYFIKDWPGAPSQGASFKVPSIIAYESDLAPEFLKSSTEVNKQLNQRRTNKVKECKWGFSVEPGKPFIECFKLLLADGMDLPSFADFSRSVPMMLEHKRKAVDLVADYFKGLMDHAMRHIESRVDQRVLATMTKTYVITVPACWPSKAREATAKAFRAAGYPAPSLISEPEAAAHHVISQMTDDAPFGKDQVVMVVDAGGGTVDLISYLVKNFEPLEPSEAAPGTAALCGGVRIDCAFAKKVESDMGSEIFNEMITKNPKGWNDCKRHFEINPKSEVNAKDNPSFELVLPGVEHALVRNGYLSITSEDVRMFFEACVKAIVDLIYIQAMEVRENGVDKIISHIILVGGLGASNYLYGELKKRLDKTKLGNKDLAILQTGDPRSAVVRGALSCALRGLIKPTYIASVNYGFTLTEERDSVNVNNKRGRKVHDGSKVHWLIRRNQVVEYNQPYEIKLVGSSLSYEVEVVSKLRAGSKRDDTNCLEDLTFEIDGAGRLVDEDVKGEGKRTVPRRRGRATPITIRFVMQYSGEEELEFKVTDVDGNEFAKTSVVWQ